MKYFLLLIFFVFLNPVSAVPSEPEPQISKLEFQGVHFGDFPSVDMICVRGLCPVGQVGVGISNNSVVPPAYNQKMAITHYHGVKISTPEFSYFDDKMFMVRFSIECKLSGVDECVDVVTRGLNAEYGLIPLVTTRSERLTGSTDFVTEAGSLISIIRKKASDGRSFPRVRIFDKFLVDRLRKSNNPKYVSAEIVILNPQETPGSPRTDH